MKKISLIFSLFFVILFQNLSFAQVPNWLWAKPIKGYDIQNANSIAIDANGNSYLIGSFKGTVDFNPGAAIYSLSSFSGSYDIYILKLDASGNFIWAKKIGGSLDDFGLSIVLDKHCNIFCTGNFQGAVDFDPGAPTYTLTATSSSNGNGDIYVLKLDQTGNFVWAKAMGGQNNDQGRSIALDSMGNIYTTGKFSGSADFDPSINTVTVFSNGSNDIFVSKLDSTGNFGWVKSMGSWEDDIANSIVTDTMGNIYTTGIFQDSVDFDPGLDTLNLIQSGWIGWDIFVSKLDNSGNFLWAKSIGGVSYDYGRDISIDKTQNLCITGSFGNVVDFDPGSSIYNISASGNFDTFVLKLDTLGNFVWAKSIKGGASSIAEGESIVFDEYDCVYVAGQFSGTEDFDPSLNSYNLTSLGGSDSFVWKLDSNGNFVWAKSAGGSLGESANSIAIDYMGKLILTGQYSSNSASFGTTILTNSGSYTQCYVAKLDNFLISTNIEDVLNENYISLYPNPSAENIRISLLKEYKKIALIIYDAQGKLVFNSEQKDCSEILLNLKDFEAGVYILKVKTDQFYSVKKMVISK